MELFFIIFSAIVACVNAYLLADIAELKYQVKYMKSKLNSEHETILRAEAGMSFRYFFKFKTKF